MGEADARGIPLAPVERFQAVPGRGILGKLHGQAILAGNLAMMREAGVDPAGFDAQADALAGDGKTPL